MRRSLLVVLVLALHACGGEPAADLPEPPTPPPAPTQRQRAEAVGASRLPGAHGVSAALRAADAADARAAAVDTSGAP
jgi:hypothetical protein